MFRNFWGRATESKTLLHNSGQSSRRCLRNLRCRIIAKTTLGFNKVYTHSMSMQFLNFSWQKGRDLEKRERREMNYDVWGLPVKQEKKYRAFLNKNIPKNERQNKTVLWFVSSIPDQLFRCFKKLPFITRLYSSDGKDPCTCVQSFSSNAWTYMNVQTYLRNEIRSQWNVMFRVSGKFSTMSYKYS